MTIRRADPRPSRIEQRWFGCLLLAVFSALGAVIGWQSGSLRLARVLIGIGLTMTILYYAMPPLRVPLYRAWMALTMPIGRLISTAVLAVIYFLVLTPMAWLMRLAGRDHLQRRFDPAVETYWTDYSPGGDEERYFRQS